MSKKIKNVESHAKVDLVRNPFLFPISDEVMADIDSHKINESIFEIRNQDELYNCNVSVADDRYEASNKIKESANMRYIKVSSGIIPDKYLQSLIISGANSDEDFAIPYDYCMVTRGDISQFLIAENIATKPVDPELHKYSIIRYKNKREGFIEDSVYGAVDLGRLLNGDQEYIDVFANQLLSEQRLNESLMTTAQSLDAQKSDETDHAEQYIGYINSKNLAIESDYNEHSLPIFGKSDKEEGVQSSETSLVVYSNKLIDRIFRAISSINKFSKRFREEIIDKPSNTKGKIIPVDEIEKIRGDFILKIQPNDETKPKEKDDKEKGEYIEVQVDKSGSISIDRIKEALEEKSRKDMQKAALERIEKMQKENMLRPYKEERIEDTKEREK